MMKKALTLVLAGVTALSLTACGGGASASATIAPALAERGETRDDEAKAPEKDVKTTTLKLAFNQSEKHLQYLALSEMSDVFYEATGGAYRIEISPNELLGPQKDAFELVQNGTTQIVMVANSIAENVNPDFAVLGLSYAYDSAEHQKKVFTSGVLDDIFVSIEANNFGVMAAFTVGARCIYTDKPVQIPADLKGYKIRVMESQTCIAMLDVMGGVGTPMAQGEVYAAAQQGVIDGGENNEIIYADLKRYEVAPYFSYTHYLMIPDPLVMNTATLKGMSKEDQQILKDLCRKYTEREFQLWNENLEDVKKTAEEVDAQFIDMGTASFQEACRSAIDNVTSKNEGAEALCEEIRSLVNQQGFVESRVIIRGISKENPR